MSVASFFLISRKYRKNEGLFRDFLKAHAPDWSHGLVAWHAGGRAGSAGGRCAAVCKCHGASAPACAGSRALARA